MCGGGYARRKGGFSFWATPLMRLDTTNRGARPQQGRSPKIIPLLSAGHSHRRTSGGKAEAGVALTLEAKPTETQLAATLSPSDLLWTDFA
jgi:hypothetical protein